MGREKNRVSPEIAKQLVEIARQMRREVYAEDGVPKWGTKFSQIEGDCVAVGQELARLMIEQSVEGQTPQVPDEALACSGETAVVLGSGEPTTIETPVGEVNWKQPKALLAKARWHLLYVSGIALAAGEMRNDVHVWHRRLAPCRSQT